MVCVCVLTLANKMSRSSKSRRTCGICGERGKKDGYLQSLPPNVVASLIIYSVSLNVLLKSILESTHCRVTAKQ